MSSVRVETSISAHGSQKPLVLVPADAASHLNQQGKVVYNLFQQHQQRLSEAEREWIQNVINYTSYVLKAFFAQSQIPVSDGTIMGKIQAFFGMVPPRQSKSESLTQNTQLHLAMHGLSSAMTMLSWYVHAAAPLQQKASTLFDRQSVPILAESELSRFLNRRRIAKSGIATPRLGRSSTLKEEVETTIAELRAADNLLRNDHRAAMDEDGAPTGTSELPFSLVETVERWRQNAEEALMMAMLGYFEQEELLRAKLEDKTITTKNPAGDHALKKGPTRVPTPDEINTDATDLQPSHNTGRTIQAQVNSSERRVSAKPRRKPLPVQPLSDNTTLVSPILPSTTLSANFSSSKSAVSPTFTATSLAISQPDQSSIYTQYNQSNTPQIRTSKSSSSIRRPSTIEPTSTSAAPKFSPQSSPPIPKHNNASISIPPLPPIPQPTHQSLPYLHPTSTPDLSSAYRTSSTSLPHPSTPTSQHGTIGRASSETILPLSLPMPPTPTTPAPPLPNLNLSPNFNVDSDFDWQQPERRYVADKKARRSRGRAFLETRGSADGVVGAGSLV